MDKGALRSLVPVQVVNGVRTPDDTRELAYETWAWKLGRNMAATARELGVSRQVVQVWAKDGGWRERYAEERRDYAPASARAIVGGGLVDAAVYGSEYLSRIFTGDAAPDKVLVAAAIAAVDRVGFGPFSAADRLLERENAQAASTGPADDATDAEVVAWLQRRIGGG
jgi:hypothetical protein